MQMFSWYDKKKVATCTVFKNHVSTQNMLGIQNSWKNMCKVLKYLVLLMKESRTFLGRFQVFENCPLDPV